MRTQFLLVARIDSPHLPPPAHLSSVPSAPCCSQTWPSGLAPAAVGGAARGKKSRGRVLSECFLLLSTERPHPRCTPQAPHTLADTLTASHYSLSSGTCGRCAAARGHARIPPGQTAPRPPCPCGRLVRQRGDRVLRAIEHQHSQRS